MTFPPRLPLPLLLLVLTLYMPVLLLPLLPPHVLYPLVITELDGDLSPWVILRPEEDGCVVSLEGVA